MPALTVPAALAIALHCAPGVDPAMMVGVAQHESRLEPLVAHDNTTGQTLSGNGVIEAARHRISEGHSVDLGPWQINSRNLDLLHLDVVAAFDPCQAVAAAARLIKIFSTYNTGSPTRGIRNGYAGGVMAAYDTTRSSQAPDGVPQAVVEQPPSAPAPGVKDQSSRDPNGWDWGDTFPSDAKEVEGDR